MTRRRTYSLPDNLSFDQSSGRFRYRDPLTAERTWLGRDREHAISESILRNESVASMREKSGSAPSVASVISDYIKMIVPTKPWDDGTRKNHVFALKLYKCEFRGVSFPSLDRIRLGDWFSSRCHTADSYNKHRTRWIDIYRYAISRGVVDFNEAEATLKRSASKKIPQNRKLRNRLSVDHFWAIHQLAPPWLQIAMEISLITLQSRAEICRMKNTDLRGNWLYVIRDKSAGDSDMAFIRIAVTASLRTVWSRAWRDGVACPYLIHRVPVSRRPQHVRNKLHPFSMEPGFLSKSFRATRDNTRLFEHLEKRERPTFHEIRSLGARIYRHLGWGPDRIQRLMTHADDKTTEIYLTNPEQLTEQHFIPVEASMDLDSIPRI